MNVPIFIRAKDMRIQLCVLVFSFGWFVWGTTEARRIILPCIVSLNVSVFFLCSLWRRDKILPLFEVGSMFLIACLLYTLIPAIGFLANDLQYTIMSSLEMNELAPNAKELEPFIWRYVLFTISFAFVYLWHRPRGIGLRSVESLPPKGTLLIPIILILFTEILFVYLGIDIRASYDRIGEVFDAAGSMPIIGQQIFGHLYTIAIIFKMYFIVVLIAQCRKGKQQQAVLFCVLTIVALYFANIGSRTETVVLLVTCGLVYHRFVKPIGIIASLIGGILLLAGFSLVGLIRGGSGLKTNIELLSLMISADVPLLQISNEFQAYFGYNYNLLVMKQSGVLEIPTQLYFYDFLLLIPRQFLPFEKLMPGSWYNDFSDIMGYFTFNPIAQSIVGLDWIELVLRGTILGWIFGKLHGWYLRRSSSLLVNFSYLFITVWSYYSIKDSTFILMYFVVYKLIPAILIIRLLTNLMLDTHRNPPYLRSFRITHREHNATS